MGLIYFPGIQDRNQSVSPVHSSQSFDSLSRVCSAPQIAKECNVLGNIICYNLSYFNGCFPGQELNAFVILTCYSRYSFATFLVHVRGDSLSLALTVLRQ